jgi:hypothetical protein
VQPGAGGEGRPDGEDEPSFESVPQCVDGDLDAEGEAAVDGGAGDRGDEQGESVGPTVGTICRAGR